MEAPAYDRFVALLIERVRWIRQGIDNGSYSTDVGALVTEQQVEIVRSHVQDAVARGATIATGGNTTGGFFEPTILLDVDHSMACMRDETFGPTIPVMKVADEEEAIRLANDSQYGLSATVSTKDIDRGRDIAHRFEAGAVNINDAYSNLFCFPLPQGGWKSSGLGYRLGGPQGIRKYCRQQAITAPRVPRMENQLLWYPVLAPARPHRWRVAAPGRGPRCRAATTAARPPRSLAGCLRGEVKVGKPPPRLEQPLFLRAAMARFACRSAQHRIDDHHAEFGNRLWPARFSPSSALHRSRFARANSCSSGLR